MRRLTQKELADHLNVHSSMVTRWQQGQIHPKHSQILEIAKALSVPHEELLNSRIVASTRGTRVSVDGDPELSELLEQLSSLDGSDRQALKAVIQAMVMKNRVRDAVLAPQQKIAV